MTPDRLTELRTLLEFKRENYPSCGMSYAVVAELLEEVDHLEQALTVARDALRWRTVGEEAPREGVDVVMRRADGRYPTVGMIYHREGKPPCWDVHDDEARTEEMLPTDQWRPLE